MSFKTVSEYQADLIPAPNNIQPNFMAWVEANFQMPVDIQSLMEDYLEGFDINTAVGPQLEALGDILNLPRLLPYQPGGGRSAIVENDDTYRLILKCKIILTTWRGTKQEIYDFWKSFLPEYPILISDNQDMSMTVLIIGMPETLEDTISFALGDLTGHPEWGGLGTGYWAGFQNFIRSLVLHGYFSPKPSGVQVNYSFQDQPVFALGMNSDYLKGFGQGYWASF